MQAVGPVASAAAGRGMAGPAGRAARLAADKGMADLAGAEPPDTGTAGTGRAASASGSDTRDSGMAPLEPPAAGIADMAEAAHWPVLAGPADTAGTAETAETADTPSTAQLDYRPAVQQADRRTGQRADMKTAAWHTPVDTPAGFPPGSPADIPLVDIRVVDTPADIPAARSAAAASSAAAGRSVRHVPADSRKSCLHHRSGRSCAPFPAAPRTCEAAVRCRHRRVVIIAVAADRFMGIKRVLRPPTLRNRPVSADAAGINAPGRPDCQDNPASCVGQTS